MTGLTLIQQETFTSDGNSRSIRLPGGANKVIVTNQPQATAAGTGVITDAFRWTWWDSYAVGTTLVDFKSSTTHVVNTDGDTNRLMLYRDEYPSPEAAKAATAITAANPAVVTATAHGYSVGDKVLCTNTTVMNQIGGMEFEVTAVGGANAFTLGYLNASGFAGAETSCNFRRTAPEVETMPGARFITNISQAASAVVTFSVGHDYQLDDVLHFRVPRINATRWGMVEMDNLEGKVTALTASTVTVDIDSTGFTAFAFAVTGDVPFSFPFAVLAGKRGLYDDWFSSSRVLRNLDPFRDGLFVPYMFLDGGAGQPGGANGEAVVFEAYRSQ